ncbi:UPF0716 protein FxsA [Acetoanaerobium pronyense]|uniref:UPF0716 protein FxsA n=1 Tax=Acetoanaerobium pronyense TaxID=1482736 RepID=A0ABS4KK14_9FIRM|nr:FxsA family protein [Acetoanaerobium pronyense]MBP2027675.1 UPF0716 protein FxsA [Acetoanaerobium pronyense]
MFFKLILAFTVIPVIELWILIRLGSEIGILNTILIVFLTGVVGAFLAKKEGLGIVNRIRMDMSQGKMPADELINGLCVLVGGAMLLTPGIFTDLIGLSLVIPGTRNFIKTKIREKMKKGIESGTIIYYGPK